MLLLHDADDGEREKDAREVKIRQESVEAEAERQCGKVETERMDKVKISLPS